MQYGTGSSEYDIPPQHLGLNKNMSHSTGVSGFGLERVNAPGDKLKLLKSNSKYANNSADSSVSPSKERVETKLNDDPEDYKFVNTV